MQTAATETRPGTLEFSGLASGEINLLRGTPNPLKGGWPFRFANMDQDGDRAGWLTLGRIVIL